VGGGCGPCPYFLSLDMYKKADIVFMPYNYVIDPGMRDVLGDRLKDAVVLLDEAHNIGESIFGYFWLFFGYFLVIFWLFFGYFLVIFWLFFGYFWLFLVILVWAIVLTSCFFYRERVLGRREFRPPRRAPGAGDQRGARGVRGGEHGRGAEW
jgi:hypothetical protein